MAGVLLLVCSEISDAQKLVGVTSGGGQFGGGMVFRINTDGSQFVHLKDFVEYPAQALITVDTIGTIYGVAGAGVYGGILFTIKRDGTNFKTLHTFDIATGSPASSVVLASDGHIYGTTHSTNVAPSIYRINPDGTGFVVVYTFPSATDLPGALFESHDGKLYSVNGDAIISINKDGSGLKVVHKFSASNVSSYTTLTQDTNGIFYGVGPGGANGNGQIYKLASDGTGFTDLFDFDSSTGQTPALSLTLGLDGKLYGSTSSGGANNMGTLFSIEKDGTGYQKIYDFTVADGSITNPQLMQDGFGTLYGTTAYGGPHHAGVIFRIRTDGTQYQKIYDFENNYSSVGQVGGSVRVFANALLGVNFFGGGFGGGNLFALQVDGSGYVDLHDFGGPESQQPFGRLVQGKDSLLYGTTLGGGVHGVGTLFAMKPTGAGFTKLFDFSDASGGNPGDGPTQANDGTLYGTTTQGGAYGGGTLYKIPPGGSFTKLLDVSSNIDVYSQAVPLVGIDGNIYGMSVGGGPNGLGSIYSCKPDGTNLVSLLSFDFNNGANPYCSLVQSGDGTLFGTSGYGGANSGGVIFSIKPDGTAFTKLHEFSFTDDQGEFPVASPTIGQDGNLYGVTYTSGTGSVGVFYTLQKDGSNFKKLYDFQKNTGIAPVGPLVEVSKGVFYGLASGGGKNNSGAVFSIQSDGSNYKDLYDFPAGTSYYLLNGLTLLNVRKQTISFNPVAESIAGGPSFSLSASASSGMPVVFSSTTPALVQLNGNVATPVAPGLATIIATQPGDGVYNDVTTQRSFCIDPPTPSITLSPVNNTILISSAASGNQWYLNGMAMADSTRQTLTIQQLGNYSVKVSVGPCSSGLSAEEVITTLTEVSPRAEKNISVYPSPAESGIILDLSATSAGPVDLQVVDVLGRPKEISTVEGNTKVALNIAGWPAGVYLFRATQMGNVYTGKFLKK